MQSFTNSTLIIGGGVFGLAVGWALARQGQPVTLLEKDNAGRSASWSAAGMLMPWKLSSAFSDDLFRLQQYSYGLWPEFAAELAEATNIELAYQTEGRYFVTVTQQAAKRLRRQFEFHHQAGVPVTWFTGDEARQQQPVLGPEVTATVYSPLGHWVDNRQVVLALREAFLQAGGTLHEQTTVAAVLAENSAVRGVRLEDDRILPVHNIIVAAGAWSSQVAGLPPVLRQAVHPRKGQTLMLQMEAEAPLIRHNLIGPVYMVPRPDGRLIVGTTVERQAGFNVESTAGGIFHMLRKARQMVPAIDDLPLIETGAGLRPTGPDRLPVLGPTRVRGLFVATGGHSYGILLAPAVAQAITELVLSGKTPPVIAPFAPAVILHR